MPDPTPEEIATAAANAALQAQQQINAISTAIRPPVFSADRPALWFAQLERLFTLNRITSETTKFNYASSFLETRAATEVEDLILTPPAEEPYTKLRDTLIARLTSSREARLKQLIEREELGDRTPSQFLRHLKRLDSGLPDPVLQTFWLTKLPDDTQKILGAVKEPTLDELSDAADRIHLVNPRANIAAAEAESSLLKKIEELTHQVKELTSKVNAKPPRSRSTSGSHNTNTTETYQENPDFCFFHNRFGDKARKCREPCKFQGNANASR